MRRTNKDVLSVSGGRISWGGRRSESFSLGDGTEEQGIKNDKRLTQDCVCAGWVLSAAG